MITSSYLFKDVTLLVTHYNRSSSLERLLKTFKEQGFSFGDIVVSDDGSAAEHLDAVKNLAPQYSFRLITTPKNKGLGNNINKGQKAVNTPFTLYVQEDFVPAPVFGKHFQNSLEIMEKEPELDIIRYYAYIPYPCMEPYGQGFSRMVFKNLSLKYKKIYVYSDHPHLRRSTFLQKFGQYAEGVKGDKTEYLMCLSFIQNKGKGLFYNDFKSLFFQLNSSEEPSTMSRSSWRQSNGPLISVVRDIYRQFKYNFDIHFVKAKLNSN